MLPASSTAFPLQMGSVLPLHHALLLPLPSQWWQKPHGLFGEVGRPGMTFLESWEMVAHSALDVFVDQPRRTHFNVDQADPSVSGRLCELAQGSLLGAH